MRTFNGFTIISRFQDTIDTASSVASSRDSIAELPPKQTIQKDSISSSDEDIPKKQLVYYDLNSPDTLAFHELTICD